MRLRIFLPSLLEGNKTNEGDETAHEGGPHEAKGVQMPTLQLRVQE